jgi:hypothetical protein
VRRRHVENREMPRTDRNRDASIDETRKPTPALKDLEPKEDDDPKGGTEQVSFNFGKIEYKYTSYDK